MFATIYIFKIIKIIFYKFFKFKFFLSKKINTVNKINNELNYKYFYNFFKQNNKQNSVYIFIYINNFVFIKSFFFFSYLKYLIVFKSNSKKIIFNNNLSVNYSLKNKKIRKFFLNEENNIYIQINITNYFINKIFLNFWKIHNFNNKLILIKNNFNNLKKKNILYKIKYSVSDFFKNLSKKSLKTINMLFLRKNKVFNKGRYSRNRQYYKTGVYWCLYINIIAIVGIYFWFYRFNMNFGYLWWFFYFFIISLIFSKIIFFNFLNLFFFYSHIIESIKWFFNLIYLLFNKFIKFINNIIYLIKI